MKTLPLILLAFSPVAAFGQPITVESNAPTPVLEGEWTETERGPNFRVWEQIATNAPASAASLPRPHRYQEFATGMNYLSNGIWAESKETIEILPDGGAAALCGQHQGWFPSDIYDGVIELATPAGQRLRSRPLGLSYFDGTNSVLICALTNSTGFILSTSNQVLYPAAFDGGVNASIRYTYTRSGFEQNIILNEQLPGPEKFPGLDPSSARLQVLTEFFSPPEPVVSRLSVSDVDENDSDETLDFALMRMTRGSAFLLNATEDATR